MKNQQTCSKHGQNATFVCSIDGCKDRIICEQCRTKDPLHFSHHATYIYTMKQFLEFDNSKMVIPKLQKGINDCDTYVTTHKKFYQQEMAELKEDFRSIREQFLQISESFQKVYMDQFSKQMNKFDQSMQSLKAAFREYTKEKSSQDSFFTMLFSTQSPVKSLEQLLVKNNKAFKIRAEIIDLRSAIATAKNSQSKYKPTNVQNLKYNQLKSHFVEFVQSFYSRFKELLTTQGKSRSNPLKQSINQQTKSLTMSRALSAKTNNNIPIELHRSMVNDKNLQKATLPQLHPTVANVLKSIRPLPSGNIDKRDEGPYRYPNGVYFGHYQKGMRHGRGLFVFSDGCCYEGSWENDVMSGYGRLIKMKGFYEGQIKEGKAHGKGSYEDAYRTYSGQWREDLRHGYGEEEFKSGKRRKYLGMFANDKYEGKGKLIDQDYIYEGTFKQGQFHGQNCVIKFKNGELFTGYFDSGFKHFGRHHFVDGSFYEGKFKNNIPNGPGDFSWADGISYSGEWKDGLQDGVGIQTFPDGRRMTGIWQAGQWVKWK